LTGEKHISRGRVVKPTRASLLSSSGKSCIMHSRRVTCTLGALLLYQPLSYLCIRPQPTSVSGLKLLVYEA
jgi:hypothetical protein